MATPTDEALVNIISALVALHGQTAAVMQVVAKDRSLSGEARAALIAATERYEQTGAAVQAAIVAVQRAVDPDS